MAGFTVFGATPQQIKYNDSSVKKVIYKTSESDSGTVVWWQQATVEYTGYGANATVEAHRNYTLTTTAPSQAYVTGDYTYTLKVPYIKTAGGDFKYSCTLHLYLRDSNGNNLIDFGSKTLSMTGSPGAEFTATYTVTSATWLGNVNSYILYSPGAGGSNKDDYKWDSGKPIVLTMVTP